MMSYVSVCAVYVVTRRSRRRRKRVSKVCEKAGLAKSKNGSRMDSDSFSLIFRV